MKINCLFVFIFGKAVATQFIAQEAENQTNVKEELKVNSNCSLKTLETFYGEKKITRSRK